MRSERWVAHPKWAWLLRVTSVLIPLAAAYVAASVVGSSIEASGWWWWLSVAGSGVLAAALTMRWSNRLQLLAMTYEMELLFPGKAPERSAVVKMVGQPELVRSPPQLPAEAATKVMAMVLSLRRTHARTNRHPYRVAAIADLIGRQLHLEPAELERLRWGALSYEIGKLALPPDLATPDLSIEQAELFATYPARGHRMLGALSEWLGASATAVAHHTENWDGSGYPDRLMGEEIPLPARVVAVAVTFDLLISGPDAIDIHAARRHIAGAASSDFDPEIVRALLRIDEGRLRSIAGRSTPGLRRLAALRPGPVLALMATFLLITGVAMAGALLPASFNSVQFDELLAFLETTSTSTALAAPTTAESDSSLPPSSTTRGTAESTSTLTGETTTTTTTALPRPDITTTTSRAATTTTRLGTTTTSLPGSTTTGAVTTTSGAATTTTRPPTTTTTSPPGTTTTTAPTTTTAAPTTTTTAAPTTTTAVPTTTTTLAPTTTTTEPEPTTTNLPEP